MPDVLCSSSAIGLILLNTQCPCHHGIIPGGAAGNALRSQRTSGHAALHASVETVATTLQLPLHSEALIAQARARRQLTDGSRLRAWALHWFKNVSAANQNEDQKVA